MADIAEETSHLTLAETSRRLGEAIWVEERLFERLGAWSGTDLPAATKVVLSEVSRRHAWRAEQLRTRLPEVPGFAAGDVVAAPAELAAQLDATTLDDVVDVALDRLGAEYEAHIERCSAVADAAVLRTLRVVLADLRADQVALRSAV